MLLFQNSTEELGMASANVKTFKAYEHAALVFNHAVVCAVHSDTWREL